MEHQKTDKDEIQDKIYQAKTVDELLVIAVEAGDPLTEEEAKTLLQEVEAERGRAKDAFASAEDLSDEELSKVAGGDGLPLPKLKSPMDMTCRSGNIVKIYFSATTKVQYCAYWKCKKHGVVTFSSDGGYTVCPICRLTDGDKSAGIIVCTNCAYREDVGNGLWHDYCTSPAVRAMHGL